MKTTGQSTDSLSAVILRQRASRYRDLAFSILLALGIGLAISSLGGPAAPAAPATLANRTTSTVAPV